MSRLFDLISTNAQATPNGIIFGKKENGTWKDMLYKDVMLQIDNMAASILEMIGLPKNYTAEEQEKIAIISNNRPEWIITDAAVQKAGAILTPIYPTVSVLDLEYILKDASVKYIFISNQEIYDRFKSVLQNPQYQVYSFDKISGVKNYETLCVQPAEEGKLLASIANITSDTVATIIYTSGTTGNPKGVVLTHHNIYENVIASTPLISGIVKPQEKALSFLPLNHIFERTVTYMYFKLGLSIYYAESLETIGDNLREVQPSIFTCVPRVLEKVYDKIIAKGNQLKGIKKSLFFWALGLAKKYDNHKNLGAFYNFQLKLANKLIFSKWREALGNNVKAIISGSAALNAELIRIFSAANIVVMEGYGLTETSPVISVNTYENAGRHFGTVGPVIKGVTVKIAEDGEILCKGPNVMKGYYKNPELTEEAFTKDGWFKTGDIGEWYQDKFLKITDRKKEMFKTSGGKYVAPQYLENIYRSLSIINQLMITGANEKFVGALIVPEWTVVSDLLNDGNFIAESEREEWTKKPELINLVKEQVESLSSKINHIEQIKKFVLLPDEWTVDSGILTPKLSLKRKAINEKFKSSIDEIYRS